MSRHPSLINWALLALIAVALQSARSWASAVAQPSQREIEFFEKKIRPILVAHCYACHSADTKPSGGLRLDDRHGLLTGGDSGPAVIPGEPAKSLLLLRVTHKDAKRRMP